MIKIPHSLADAIDSNRCALFVGSGLSVASGLPSWQELIAEMITTCADCGLRDDDQRDLNEALDKDAYLDVAEYCREKMGARRFHDLMVNVFRDPEIDCTDIHNILPSFNFPLVLTTNYDKLLEKAFFTSSPNHLPPVYSYRNTASLARLLGESRFFILKIHGDIDDVESLILTRQDYRNAIFNNAACRATIFNLFASYSFLFLGFGINDPDLNLVLEDLYSTYGGFARNHYAFIPDPGSVRSRALSNNYNIEVIPYPHEGSHSKYMKDFLASLGSLQKSKTSSFISKQNSEEVPRPYKFLDFFDIEDTSLFFGREKETNEILKKIVSSDVVVITGKSGVGKTSLIKAGLFHQLDSLEYIPIYIRCSADMTRAFTVAFKNIVPRMSFASPLNNHEILFEEIQNYLKPNRKLILIFDQFEEFFIRISKQSQIHWRDLIINILDAPSLSVKYVFVLREDFIIELNAFRNYIPNIFNNLYRLENFSMESAKEAMCKPAQIFNITYENSVIEDLLNKLYADGIEPAHLQIVCNHLYETLAPGEMEITERHYLSVGGARDILSSHVSKVLDTLRSKDKNIARILLKQLVTSIKTKALVSFDDILKGYLNEVLSDENR